MARKYRIEIDNALVDIFLEVDKIQYNAAYRELKKRLGSLSWESFGIRINKMLAENFIEKKEVESNQKINPVFYSITKQARKKLPH